MAKSEAKSGAEVEEGVQPLELPNSPWLAPREDEPEPSLPEVSFTDGPLSCLTRQGDRPEHLDAVAHHREDRLTLLCVLDGHRGVAVPSFLADRLLPCVLALGPAVDEPERVSQGPHLDRVICEGQSEDSLEGASCLLHVLREGKLLTASVGDCRSVLYSENGQDGLEFHQLNRLHTADNPQQAKAVESRGGVVLQRKGTKRVLGQLQLTRSFGDRKFKRFISAVPEISTRELERGTHFLVSGSDGLWNQLAQEEVGEVLRRERGRQDLAESLMSQLKRKRRKLADNVAISVLRVEAV